MVVGLWSELLFFIKKMIMVVLHMFIFKLDCQLKKIIYHSYENKIYSTFQILKMVKRQLIIITCNFYLIKL